MQQTRKSDEDIMTIVNTKAAEWEGLLNKKEVELRESRHRVGELEQQLRAASGSSDKRTVTKLTKVHTNLTNVLVELCIRWGYIEIYLSSACTVFDEHIHSRLNQSIATDCRTFWPHKPSSTGSKFLNAVDEGHVRMWPNRHAASCC